MDILYKNDRIERLCNVHKKAVKKWGSPVAKKVAQRRSELSTSPSLQVLAHLQVGRFHELEGDQKGQFTMDVSGALRLVFEPANEPIPKKPDGGIDLAKVTKVRILGVEDTHE